MHRASRVQVCDWYATLTNLVGVNSSDNLHIADGPFLKPCLSLSSSPYLLLALRFCVCCIHPLLLLFSISLLSFSLSFVRVWFLGRDVFFCSLLRYTY
eukprot:COSAG06_NODE_3300_length_5535_cov_8.894776_6_plen_98_part_00